MAAQTLFSLAEMENELLPVLRYCTASEAAPSVAGQGCDPHCHGSLGRESLPLLPKVFSGRGRGVSLSAQGSVAFRLVPSSTPDPALFPTGSFSCSWLSSSAS